ncbi:MAG: proprotein convertase P-domain-containing protein [Oligoflexales bacterium]
MILFFLVFNILSSCEQIPDSELSVTKLMMDVDHLLKLTASDQEIVIPRNIPEGATLSAKGWFSWRPESSRVHHNELIEVLYWLKKNDEKIIQKSLFFQIVSFDESLKKSEELVCLRDFKFKKNHPHQKFLLLQNQPLNEIIYKKSIHIISQENNENSLYEVDLTCVSHPDEVTEEKKEFKKSHHVLLLNNFSTWDFNPEGNKYDYAIEKGGIGLHLSEDGYLHFKSDISQKKQHPTMISFWVTDGFSSWREQALIRFDKKCEKIEHQYSQVNSPRVNFRDRGIDYFASKFDQKSCVQKIFNVKTQGEFPNVLWEIIQNQGTAMQSIVIKTSPYKGYLNISLNPQIDFEKDILSLDKKSELEWVISFLPGPGSGERNISFIADNGRSKKIFHIKTHVEEIKTKKSLSSTFHTHGGLKLYLIKDLDKNKHLSVSDQLKEYLHLYRINQINLILNRKKESFLGSHYIYDFYREGKKYLDQNFIVSTYRNEIQQEIIYSIYNGIMSLSDEFGSSGQENTFFSGRREVRREVSRLKNPPVSVEYLKDVHTEEVLSKSMLSSSRYQIYLPRNLHQNNTLRATYQNHLKIDRSTELTSGRALVFEISPFFSLKDPLLSDSSPHELFYQAYQWRSLKNIQLDRGIFKLAGPRVQILDRQAPFTGQGDQSHDVWKKGRGSTSWLAAQTYYHLDSMLGYLEKIGFSEDKTLVSYPLTADPDAMNGSDNSSYDPVLKSLFFGRGGVDDAEDPDVIIHELTHALLDSMIPNFKGGDSGAIGEGAGDDLAVSYRRRHSISHDVNSKIFSWDGMHSWGGRRTNVLYSFYNHGVDHDAHMDMGGFLSDELWSTPLVTAREILLKKGYSHEILDRVILQGYLGIGYSPKMRDVATHIVHVAKIMGYEEIAEVFLDRFHWHGILSDKTKKIFLKVGKNQGLWASNKKIKIPLHLANYSSQDLESSMVFISGEKIQVPPLFIPKLKSAENKNIFVDLQLPDLKCKEFFEVQVSWATNESILATESIKKKIGAEQVLLGEWEKYRDIRYDNDVELDLYIDAEGDVSDRFQVGLTLTHNWFGDLQVDLIHPSGKEVRLIGDSRDDESYFSGWLPKDRHPVENMNKIIGLPLRGLWKLRVKDIQPDEHGAITGWKLRDYVNVGCG